MPQVPWELWEAWEEWELWVGSFRRSVGRGKGNGYNSGHAHDEGLIALKGGFLRKVAGLCLWVTAGALALLARSALVHAELLAYGLGVDSSAMPFVAAGIGVVGALCAVAGVKFWRGSAPRRWTAALATVACIFLAAFSSLLVYALEVKYELGDTNLGRVAAYARDFQVWKTRAATIRAGILKGAQLDPLPARTSLNAMLHSRREEKGYSVEDVYFESIPGFFVAGNLYRPAPAEGGAKHPVVLLPHGHFSSGRFEPSVQQLGATFARMGAIAFSYDMVGRGESRQVTHGNPNALTMQLWNSMRVLDFLLALPDADASRVGMTGASGGGTQTFLCTAVDDRVTVAAPVVMVSSWCYGGCPCEIGMPIHRGAGYATNNAEIAALAAPRPLLVVSDGSDWTRTVPRLEYPYLQKVYGLFGRQQDVENVHLAGEVHDYGPSKRQAVYRFFAKHLGLNTEKVRAADGGMDEGPNTVEPQQLLEAFNAAHPLPPNALHGWDAVLAELRSLQGEEK